MRIREYLLMHECSHIYKRKQSITCAQIIKHTAIMQMQNASAVFRLTLFNVGISYSHKIHRRSNVAPERIKMDQVSMLFWSIDVN